MAKLGEHPPPPVHLLRGSPVVRSWSKYQRTVPEWTLCGSRTQLDAPSPSPYTTQPNQVTCLFCQQLMRLKSVDTPE